MPPTEVYFYQEEDGRVPVLEWMADLRRSNPKAFTKCDARIESLEAMGHELRRPLADYLRDGIYELRAGFQGINYRILYFFHGRGIAIVAHALTKEDRIPEKDLTIAFQRKAAVERNPERHIRGWEGEHD